MQHPTIEMIRVMVTFLASTAMAFTAYDVMKRSKVSKPGAYSIAHRLTQAGWLASKVERSNPTFGMPPRTLYQVTAEGITQTRAVLELLRVST